MRILYVFSFCLMSVVGFGQTQYVVPTANWLTADNNPIILRVVKRGTSAINTTRIEFPSVIAGTGVGTSTIVEQYGTGSQFEVCLFGCVTYNPSDFWLLSSSSLIPNIEPIEMKCGTNPAVGRWVSTFDPVTAAFKVELEINETTLGSNWDCLPFKRLVRVARITTRICNAGIWSNSGFPDFIQTCSSGSSQVYNKDIYIELYNPFTSQLSVPNFGTTCIGSTPQTVIGTSPNDDGIGTYLNLASDRGSFITEQACPTGCYTLNTSGHGAGAVNIQRRWSFPGGTFINGGLTLNESFVPAGNVLSLPAVTAGGTEVFCDDTGNQTVSGASPGGGTWSGSFIDAAGVFNTIAAPVGNHIVTYTYTDGNGCSNSANKTVTINALPTVNAGADQTACQGSGNLNLTGVSPSGGTWSGSSFLVGAQFDTNAPPGGYTLTYTFTNPTTGCSNSDTKLVTILPRPAVDAGLDLQVCRLGGNVTLSGGSPAGGSWSGTSVSGSTFNPLVAGLGTFTITYTYNDGTCTNTDTRLVAVLESPTVNAGIDLSACVGSGMLALTGASPAGGTFSGTAVTGTQFDTSIGAGTYTVTYSYTDPLTGCDGSDTRSVVINALPVVEAGNNLPNVCISQADFNLSGFSPSGGVWTGPGLIGPSRFSPALAGVGIHTMTYTFTNATTGCVNSDVMVITVGASTPINIGADRTFCNSGGIYNLNLDLAPTDLGGVWSGSGVNGNNFNPGATGNGAFTITYTYTNAQGCVSTQFKQFTVVNGPAVDAGNTLEICSNGGAVALVGESPLGGSWSGLGIVGNTFDPAITGTGIFVVTYTVTTPFCVSTDTRQIVVNPPTPVSAGPNLTVCVNAPDFLITGASVNGGVYSGTGVAGGFFSPSTAGVGLFTLTYTYTNNKGCISTSTRTVRVNDAPTVNAGPDATVCSNAGVLALAAVATPSGGSFTGPGVQVLNFNPALAGVGIHQINYSYTDPVTGCSRTDFRLLTVIAPQPVTIGPNLTACINGAPIVMNAQSIPGGTYSGPGITGNSFDPTVAGIGTHIISYSVPDPSGCNSIGTRQITVVDLPAVNAGPDITVCSGAPLVSLNGTGSPTGGTFSGPFVSGGNFNVAASGSGTFQVTYTFTNTVGCSNTATKNIIVDAGATVNAGPDFSTCQGAPSIDLASRVSPSGGTFSGTGVTGSNFNPTNVGAFTITYTLSNTFGCSGTDQFVVTVNAPPSVTAGSSRSVCLNEPPLDLAATAFPSGGVFFGPGVTGNNFNALAAGVGTHTVFYTYTNAQGCSNTVSRTLTVTDLPAVNAGANLFLCLNGNLQDLTIGTSPTNGSWTGPGVTFGIFDPAAAGVGTHVARYTVVQSNGCSNFDDKVITVFPNLTVDAGPDLTVCSNAPVINLNIGASQTGGTWSGTSVSGTNFNPSVGPGSYLIAYNYTNFYGCSALDTKTITVIAPGSVSVGSDISVCITAPPFNVASSVFPTGGTFFGTGLQGTNFNPVLAGIGTHDISYTVLDALGCTTTRIRKITVTAPPVIDAGPNRIVCLNGGTIDLDASASAPGGAWSGIGTTGSFFNPLVAGLGTFVLSYVFDSGQGCVSTDTRTITVRNDITVNAGIDLTVCVSQPPIDFTTSPDRQGGVWSGIGMSGNIFSPAVAGPGVHVVNYRFGDAFGCIANDIRTITVNALPVVSAGSATTVCNTSSPINLNTVVFPAGGSWTGPGISGAFFNPAQVGNGVYNLRYQITDANGCSNSAIRQFTVQSPPVINVGNTITTCRSSGLIDLNLVSNVSGGVWSGTATSNGQFDPLFAGTGTHLLTYTFNDGLGCVSVSNKTIIVRPDPVVNAGSDISVCVNGTVVNLNTQAIPVGGSWSGIGIQSGTGNFDPATAGLGAHVLRYTFTDIYGCTVSDNKIVTVQATPFVDAGPNLSVCTTASPLNLNLTAFPSGGSWTGASISGSNFNPVIGVGTYNLTYQVTNADGCTSSDTRSVAVTLPPTISVGGNRILCVNSPRIDLDLDVSQVGGSWSGPALEGSFFNPQLAGVGTYNLTYTLNTGIGCVSTSVKTIQVRAAVSVDAGPDISLCSNGTLFNLATAVSNPGGVFSGNGVTGSNFNPALAGVGTHVITYTRQDEIGCVAIDTRTITVNGATPVDAGPDVTLCKTAPLFDLTSSVSVTGGVWSGSGVTGNNFNPQVTGLGQINLTYTFTNASGCVSTDVKRINVVLPPSVNIGANRILCVNSARIDLDIGTSPVGGNWSGPGLEGSFFNPALAGEGTHQITYTYNSGQGCITTATKTIQVRPAITVSAGANRSFCRNSGVYSMTNDPSILGGSFSGPGVSGSNFNPNTAGVGVHIITYTYDDEFGCVATATRQFTVTDIVTVNAGPSVTVCVTASPLDLTSSGFPSGGVWSGQGITANTFNPAAVGSGVYSVTYSYADANGCSGSALKQITVSNPPVVEAGSNFDICINAAPLQLTGATPASGNWSGIGIIAGVFDPLTAGLGQHVLTYTYTDGNGCTQSDFIRATVLAEPSLLIGNDFEVCSSSNPVNLMTDASIKGGTFSGRGITGSIFNPTTAGAGTHVITYTLRFNGCDLTAFRNITVNTAEMLDIGNNLTLCLAGNDRNLISDVNIVGGTFSGSGLTGSVFDPSAAGVGSHVITYTYTNAFGCSSTDFRVITVQPQLPIDAGADLTICNSAGLIDLVGRGTPANGTYTGIGVVNNVFNPVITGLGVFNLDYVVDNGNGCVSTDQLRIEVKPSAITDFGRDSIVCVNAEPIPLNFSTELQGGTWEGEGIVANLFYPNLAELGTHILTYSNPTLGCAIGGQRRMTVVGLPRAASSDLRNVSGCDGAFITLTAEVATEDRTNNVNIGWYKEDELDPFDFGEEITYQITGTERIYYKAVNQFGCNSGQRDYLTVQTNNPSATIWSNERTVGFGQRVLFSPQSPRNAESFLWDFGDGITSKEKDPWHFYYESGEKDVSLTLTSVSGCTTIIREPKWITVLPEPGREDIVLGINDQRTERNTIVSVYPNPFQDKLILSIESTHTVYYEFYLVNMIGLHQKIDTRLLQEGDNSIELDLHDIAPGMYTIRVVGPKGSMDIKVVKI